MTVSAFVVQAVLSERRGVTRLSLARELDADLSEVNRLMPHWIRAGYVRTSSRFPERLLMGPRKARRATLVRARLSDDAVYALGQLRHGPLTLGELAELLDASFLEAQKAVLTLERSGLAVELARFAKSAESCRFALTSAGHERAEVAP